MNKPSEETINKVLANLGSSHDAKVVAEWFGAGEGQLYLSEKMDKDFAQIKEGHQEVAIDHSIPTNEMYHIIMQHIRKKRRKRLAFRAAAVLLPFILITGLFFQLNSKVDLFGASDYEEVYVPKGERIQFVFQDGTRAYINSDSKIRYPKQFGLSTRNIYIEGEAYFIVTPNEKRPFVIELEKGSIRVLGTSFNVEAYPQNKDVYVSLDEGKVNLIPWTMKNHYLNPGEKIRYNKESGECTLIKNENIASASLWKNDIISFKNAPLEEVIQRLNRWYDVEFVIEDKAVFNYSYTFTSDNTLLENVLHDLAKVAPVKFVNEDKVIKISMK